MSILRILLATSLLTVPVATINAADNNIKFAGKWAGKWADRWPMSLEITSIQGDTASFVYTHPDGNYGGKCKLTANSAACGNLRLILKGSNSGQVLGNFQNNRHLEAEVSR